MPRLFALTLLSCVSRFGFAVLVHKIVSFFLLLWSWLTLVVACLGIGVLMAFYYTGTRSDLPIVLLSSAIIFPISFGISFNFNRRETALRDLATVKSSSLIVWYGCRDFPQETAALSSALLRLRHTFSVFFTLMAQKVSHKSDDIVGSQI